MPVNPAIQCVGGSLLIINTFRLVAVCVYSVLAVMTLSSPLSLSLSMQDNEQVLVDDRKEFGHCGQKGHLLLCCDC